MKIIESLIIFILGIIVGTIGWEKFYSLLLFSLEKLNTFIKGL